MSDRWCTTGEAAERLGLTQRRVQRLIDRGVLEARRTDPSAWYQLDRADVERLAAELSRSSRSSRIRVPDDETGD